MYIGRLENVGIGKEASRGVGVPAAFTIPKMAFTFDDKANKAVSSESLGHISGHGNQSIVTQLFSEGALDGELNIESFGLLWLALLGTESVSTVSGAKKHSYTLQNSNQHQTLSIHVNDGIATRVFENAVVDSMDIDITPEEIVKFSCGLKGKKGQDSVYTPAQAVDYKFIGRDAVVKIAADTASLAAASALSLKEFKISVKKNADFDFTLGTLEPENIPNKNIVVEGTIKLNHESVTFRDYMLNGSYKALSLLLNNTRDTIGSNTPQFYIELPRVDFFEWERARANDDIVTQTINFRALLDITTGKLISDSFVINTQNAY